MSVINPPPVRVPDELAKSPALFSYFNELHTFLRLMYANLAPSGEVSSGDSALLASTGLSSDAKISALQAEIESLTAQLQQSNRYMQASSRGSDSFDKFLLPISERSNEVPGYALPIQKDMDMPPYTAPMIPQSDPAPRTAPVQVESNLLPPLFNMQPEAFEYISTSTALTTSRNMIVKATASITITLNSNPEQKEVVILVRDTAAGAVTLDGGAYNINGASTNTISLNYGATVVMFLDDRWFVLA